MAFNFLQNKQQASFAEAMYDWMQFMIGAGGWTCVGSGNGTSAFSANGSSITSAATLQTDKSWFILKQPNSTRQFSFQSRSSGANWRIKYSFSGFGLPTSVSETPSASDEQIIFGSGTDALPNANPLFSGLTAGSFVNSSAADTDGYSFYFFAYSKSNLRNPGSIATLIIADTLQPGFINAADTDPFVIYVGNSGTNDIISATKPGNYTLPHFNGFMCKGISNREVFANISIASWGNPAPNIGFTLPNAGINGWCPNPNQEFNPHNNYEDLCPILYFYKNSAYPDSIDMSQGYKGTSKVFFMGSLQRNNGDFYNYEDFPGGPTQGTKIYISGFVLPWNNANPTP